MPVYRAIPLLRPLITLMLGILAGFLFPYWNKWALVGIGLIQFVFVVLFQFFSFKQKLYLRWTAGVCILGLFFLLGYFAALRKDSTIRENWFGKNKDSVFNMALILEENPAPKTKSYLATGNVVALLRSGRYQPASGKMLLRIDTSLQSQYHFKAGDTLLAHLPVHTIQNFPNSSFDMKTYYGRLQIYHQANIKASELMGFHPDISKGISYFLRQSQVWILSKLRANIIEKDNLSLAEALLIGYKDDLDRNLENAYRDAGIVHIIAISGMHLMLLYKLLEQTGLLLSKSLTAGRLTKLLSLIVIWLFAFLSGAGPSVIRAAVMLSFIVIGELFYRNSHSLNSLVASAFILLLVRPEWIWNVGFWLSYMAVAGILLFYKPILHFPDFGNPFILTIWGGIAVTLSAQILTLPVLMYCFGKIPLYFLFTNLLMVPLSSVILYMIILLLVVNWIPFLAHTVGKITDIFIGWMNEFALNVARYPIANIFVSINFAQMMVLYAIIGLIFYLLQKKKEKAPAIL